ncbi:hypothetical protein Ahu01nite_099470 [Winogradskya humida]|uniref:Secreted protein n=1 Tax=Winogradskya humida TaxID=113566 RepID=A0ABQ4A7L0_9ACTN|nr:hypothetical protein Ahu01nite_099470 [Actinoplanes humidus]
MALLRLVYWLHPAVQVSALTQAAGFAHPREMTTAIGPVPTGIACRGGAAIQRVGPAKPFWLRSFGNGQDCLTRIKSSRRRRNVTQIDAAPRR